MINMIMIIDLAFFFFFNSESTQQSDKLQQTPGEPPHSTSVTNCHFRQKGAYFAPMPRFELSNVDRLKLDDPLGTWGSIGQSAGDAQ